jgi:hypothetical protein
MFVVLVVALALLSLRDTILLSSLHPISIRIESAKAALMI